MLPVGKGGVGAFKEGAKPRVGGGLTEKSTVWGKVPPSGEGLNPGGVGGDRSRGGACLWEEMHAHSGRGIQWEEGHAHGGRGMPAGDRAQPSHLACTVPVSQLSRSLI